VFSPDGRRIVSARFVNDGVNVFDAATLALRWNAEQVRLTEAHGFRNRLGRLFGRARDEFRSESLVHHIAFTPDSRRVLYLSAHRLIIRDADTGATLGIGCGPNYLEYLQALAVSTDGKFAVTGGVDRMIRVWDIPTARELARWEAHDSEVTALAFSPDGATLASASKQGTLKLWDLRAIREELRKLGLDW
jgi:WD40 repeat protein